MDWKNFHRYQEQAGWCGVACIQMILAKAGINLSQKEIAKDVMVDWWGVPAQIMVAYLNRYFSIVNYKAGASSRDLREHIAKDHAIVLNWWDDLDGSFGNGHYTVLGNYQNRRLTMVDPSRERSGIWEISYSDFKPRWYDTLTLDNKLWSSGWLCWVDLNTKRE